MQWAPLHAGSVSSAQKLDAVTEEEEFQRFYLQYFFPPSSVGEVRCCQSCAARCSRLGVFIRSLLCAQRQLPGSCAAQVLLRGRSNIMLKSVWSHQRLPACCCVQTGRMGGAGRREVGHGNLAERALAPAVPSQEDWPYTVRPRVQGSW